MLKDCISRIFCFTTKILLTISNCFRHSLRRALCFRRTRRYSDNDDIPVLTAVGVVPNNVQDGQDWNQWEDESQPKLTAVEQHIQMYRQQRANLRNQAQEKEENSDYFLDMTPRIIKQTKVLLKNSVDQPSVDQSNLSFKPDSFTNTGELGEWDESQTWEDQVQPDCDVTNIIREQKRSEREKRLFEQQRRKEENIIRID